MTTRRYTTFSEFWPYYLSEHSLPATRLWHFIGSWVGLVNLVLAVVLRSGWYVLAGFLSGYAFAWVSHFFIEKNRPATFTYPLWSFAGDWKMWFFTLTGRLGAELERAQVTPRPATRSTDAAAHSG